MSDVPARPARRRRADARRSITGILNAAIELLGRRPEASLEEIAAAAGVARQTIYAHFPSRDALLAATADLVTGEATAAAMAVDLDAGSPVDALRRWADVLWGLVEEYPILLTQVMAASAVQADGDLQLSMTTRLGQVILRGQRTGAFDPALAPDWLVTAILNLGRAAGYEVQSGRMSSGSAGAAFRESAVRVCLPLPPGAAPSRQ